MKKFTWIGFLIIAGLLLTKGVGRAEDLKIGIVDVNKIYSNYTKAVEGQAEFIKLGQERQADLQKKADATDKEIKALQDKLEKQGKVMKKEESDKITADIEKKKMDFVNLQQKFYQEMQTKKTDLIETLAKETETAIAKLAKEKGYSLVINKEALSYSLEAADLSDQVIAILNKPAAVKK